MDDAMQEKADRANALASREAMAAAFAGAGGTLAGAVRKDKPAELPAVACGGSYL